MIKAEIIADSIAPSKKRITTFSLTYPRFIHSEFMTHRVFSRNASSSRAIPFKKQVEYLKQDLAYPEIFTYNQKGMQGEVKVTSEDDRKARTIWYAACQNAINSAEILGLPKDEGGLNIHKQHCNRLLEPFLHINVLCTATTFDNFFGLRYHKDAQPEIKVLAKKMFTEYNSSNPETLRLGEWHLPYINEEDKRNLRFEEQIKKSVACCARVSYKTFDGKEPSQESCERIYDKLLGSSPIHASPAEHQAMALGDPNCQSGNLTGWMQYRKTLEGENINKFVKEIE